LLGGKFNCLNIKNAIMLQITKSMYLPQTEHLSGRHSYKRY